MFGFEILAHLYFFLSHVFERLEMRATRDFGIGISNYAYWTFWRSLIWPFLKSTHVYFTCGTLSIWTLLWLEILAHINFFSLVSSRAFRDVPHSRSRCRDSYKCLPNFLKALLLALPQIYTRVFHLWKSIDLNIAWVGDSCPYILSFLS